MMIIWRGACSRTQVFAVLLSFTRWVCTPQVVLFHEMDWARGAEMQSTREIVEASLS